MSEIQHPGNMEAGFSRTIFWMGGLVKRVLWKQIKLSGLRTGILRLRHTFVGIRTFGKIIERDGLACLCIKHNSCLINYMIIISMLEW